MLAPLRQSLSHNSHTLHTTVFICTVHYVMCLDESFPYLYKITCAKDDLNVYFVGLE